MACPDPFDAVAIATEHLSNDIYMTAVPNSFWLNAITRGKYDGGRGLTTTTYQMANIRPDTDEEAWTPIQLISAEALQGPCSVTFKEVPWGYDEHTYSPEEFALRGPTICRDQLLFSTPEKVTAFFTKYIGDMARLIDAEWTNRYRKVYMELSNKMSLVGNGEIVEFSHSPSAGNWPTTAPTSELTQCYLDTIASRLNTAGANQPDKNGYITLGDQGPVYTLEIGQEMSNKLTRVNAELRADYRFADMGKGDQATLMQRIGATRILFNFRHRVVLDPPRFTFVGGAFVRVNYWVTEAASKGTKFVVNPLWLAAPYEAAIVVNPMVFMSEILAPMNATAPGINFDPINWSGDWKWVTGRDAFVDPTCFDPYHNRGAHFAILRHAPKPMLPEYGWTILFKRCQPQCTPTCSYDS